MGLIYLFELWIVRIIEVNIKVKHFHGIDVFVRIIESLNYGEFE